ncbi:MAG: GyrI-like domain-containing protein [Verrucomicrobia bacterium]|nr:GyrI-like domain-containing protein [Verrucomicrobiota bacterium]
MGLSVTVQTVSPRLIAAVRRKVAVGDVGATWRPALDQVWAFLRTHPGLCEGGHNIFLYHQPARCGDPMEVDFGIEVVREFDPSGEVRPVKTPGGEVVVATHVGPYDQLGQAYDAIHAWAAANDRALAGKSWEIYGDWQDDPAKLETTVMFLLV